MMKEGHYSCIVSDPPWHFKVRSPKGEGRSASQHYGVASLDDLKSIPVASWAAPDCALIMWAIDPMLPQALELMSAWDFTFRTVCFYWVKTNRDGTPFTGMGFWTRACPEQALLGTRGHPKRLHKDVRRLIMAPRREHSRKPDEVISRIERLLPGPYLEMFARERRPGWDAFGNECDKFAPITPPVITFEKDFDEQSHY